jgi:hypothetical protein
VIMEKVYEGTPIRRGPGSLALRFPQMIAEHFDAKLETVIEYFYDGDNLVLKFPKKSEEKGDEF